MKKIIISCIILIVMLSGCSRQSQNNEQLIELQNNQINLLESKIIKLKQEHAELEEDIKNIKVENNLAKYIITLNISQSHFTLDLEEHIKDSMNDIDIQIPVDKEFYDSVKEGDVLNDTFRVGSLLMKGSFGKWQVQVTKKEIW